MDSPTKKGVRPKQHPYTYYTNYPSIKLKRQANQKYPNTYNTKRKEQRKNSNTHLTKMSKIIANST